MYIADVEDEGIDVIELKSISMSSGSKDICPPPPLLPPLLITAATVCCITAGYICDEKNSDIEQEENICFTGRTMICDGVGCGVGLPAEKVGDRVGGGEGGRDVCL